MQAGQGDHLVTAPVPCPALACCDGSRNIRTITAQKNSRLAVGMMSASVPLEEYTLVQ